jgi:hypothetical protein
VLHLVAGEQHCYGQQWEYLAAIFGRAPYQIDIGRELDLLLQSSFTADLLLPMALWRLLLVLGKLTLDYAVFSRHLHDFPEFEGDLPFLLRCTAMRFD